MSFLKGFLVGMLLTNCVVADYIIINNYKISKDDNQDPPVYLKTKSSNKNRSYKFYKDRISSETIPV